MIRSCTAWPAAVSLGITTSNSSTDFGRRGHNRVQEGWASSARRMPDGGTATGSMVSRGESGQLGDGPTALSVLSGNLEAFQGLLLILLDHEKFIEPGDLEHFKNVSPNIAQSQLTADRTHLLIHRDQFAKCGTRQIFDIAEVQHDFLPVIFVHQPEQLVADHLDVSFVQDLTVGELRDGDVVDLLNIQPTSTLCHLVPSFNYSLFVNRRRDFEEVHPHFEDHPGFTSQCQAFSTTGGGEFRHEGQSRGRGAAVLDCVPHRNGLPSPQTLPPPRIHLPTEADLHHSTWLFLRPPHDEFTRFRLREPGPVPRRWVVLGFLFSLTVVLYIDRICIAQAAKQMEKDLGFCHTEMSIIYAAFTIAYGLFEIPTGRWGDKYGSRGVLARIVLWWSIFTILTGSVWRFSFESSLTIRLPYLGWSSPLLFDSFMLLLLIRFLFGAGEAGALPNAARISSRWFSIGERSLVQGVVVTGMSIGGAVSPMITAQLISGIGWRGSFAVFGLVGMVWTAAFYFWFRDDPARHPAVNAGELMLINYGRKTTDVPAELHPPVPWKYVLRSLNVWARRHNDGGRVLQLSVPLLVFHVPAGSARGDGRTSGAVDRSGPRGFGGRLPARRLLRKWTVELPWGRAWGRRWLGFIAMAIGAVFLWLSVQMESPLAASLCAATVGMTAFSQQTNWWAAVTETSGRHLGAVFGLLNMLGAPGGVASQLFMGMYADYRKAGGFTGRAQWDPRVLHLRGSPVCRRLSLVAGECRSTDCSGRRVPVRA